MIMDYIVDYENDIAYDNDDIDNIEYNINIIINY